MTRVAKIILILIVKFRRSFVPPGDARLRSGGGSSTSSLPGDTTLVSYPSILSTCQSEYDPLFNTCAQSGKPQESDRFGIVAPILTTRDYYNDMAYQHPSRGPSMELPSRTKGSLRHKDVDLLGHRRENLCVGEPGCNLTCVPRTQVNHGMRLRNHRPSRSNPRKAVVHNTLNEKCFGQTWTSGADEPKEVQTSLLTPSLPQGPLEITKKSLDTVQDADPMDGGPQTAKELENNIQGQTGLILREPSDMTISRARVDIPMENSTIPKSPDSKKNIFQCGQCQKVKESASKLKWISPHCLLAFCGYLALFFGTCAQYSGWLS